MKKCSRCKEEKSFDNFWKDKTTSSGYKSYCKNCKPNRKDYHDSWRSKNREKVNAYSRKTKARPESKIRERERAIERNYNISVDEYNRIVQDQNGVCAICERIPTRAFSIDHDHNCCPERSRSCGKCIRGLLCQTCNQALGMFLDSPEILLNAVEYLRASERV
jgi:hypothetical protein